MGGARWLVLLLIVLPSCGRSPEATVKVETLDPVFTREVLESKEPVLVDFWAPWCGPCRIVGPMVDELGTELKVKVFKVNIDELPEVARFYNVGGIPALMVFKNGGVHQNMEVIPARNTREAIRVWLEGAIQ